jgi:hypothetical protein
MGMGKSPEHDYSGSLHDRDPQTGVDVDGVLKPT